MRWRSSCWVLAVGLVACEGSNPTSPGMSGGQGDPQRNQPKPPVTAPVAKDTGELPACHDRPYFDALPLAIDDIRAVRPLGFLAPPRDVFPARHTTFVRAQTGRSARTALKFPGRAWVTSIGERPLGGEQNSYEVTFAPCRELRATFSHIAAVSPKLLAEMGKATPVCDTPQATTGARHCEYAMRLEVASADVLGESDDASGVDMALTDTRVAPAAFVVPGHYATDWLHTASPLLYFAPSLRSSLAAKLSNDAATAQRSTEPVVGSHVQDVAGTAQGNWFPAGRDLTKGGETSDFLALVHDHVDPAQPVFAVGSSVPGLGPALLTFAPSAKGVRNRNFSDVKPDGNVYCYDGFTAGPTAGGLAAAKIEGAVLLALTDAHTLRIERTGAAGTRCADLRPLQLTAAAVTFQR